MKIVKNNIKSLYLWLLKHRRRVHIFGVGAAKTGTSSIGRILGEVYRTGVESHPEFTINLLKDAVNNNISNKEVKSALKVRDKKSRLECDVGHFLGPLTTQLSEAFKGARFIVTIRHPKDWLSSVINQCINKPKSDIGIYKDLRYLYYGKIPNERPYEEKVLDSFDSVHSIDGYMSYWSWHYNHVLHGTNENNRIILRTSDISNSLSRIAHFIDVNKDSLSDAKTKDNTANKRYDVLSKIDDRYIDVKIDKHCSTIMEYIEKTSSIVW